MEYDPYDYKIEYLNEREFYDAISKIDEILQNAYKDEVSFHRNDFSCSINQLLEIFQCEFGYLKYLKYEVEPMICPVIYQHLHVESEISKYIDLDDLIVKNLDVEKAIDIALEALHGRSDELRKVHVEVEQIEEYFRSAYYAKKLEATLCARKNA